MRKDELLSFTVVVMGPCVVDAEVIGGVVVAGAVGVVVAVVVGFVVAGVVGVVVAGVVDVVVAGVVGVVVAGVVGVVVAGVIDVVVVGVVDVVVAGVDDVVVAGVDDVVVAGVVDVVVAGVVDVVVAGVVDVVVDTLAAGEFAVGGVGDLIAAVLEETIGELNESDVNVDGCVGTLIVVVDASTVLTGVANAEGGVGVFISVVMSVFEEPVEEPEEEVVAAAVKGLRASVVDKIGPTLDNSEIVDIVLSAFVDVVVPAEGSSVDKVVNGVIVVSDVVCEAIVVTLHPLLH